MNDPNDSSRGDPSRRTDPVLGNLDHIDTGERRGAAARGGPSVPLRQRAAYASGRPARRWWPLVVVAVLVVAGALAWSQRTTLSNLLPQTQLNALLTRADKAYASGNLVDGPGSARSLYEAAQALDPDNEQALAGLHKVGADELAQARTALAKRDFDGARAALEQARGLLGGGSGVTEVDQALAKAILQSANVDVLIGQARAALANGRIDGHDGAAALFGRVLAGDPHNAVARHGMDQVGNLLADRVRTLLAAGDRAGARQALASEASLLPGYSQLPNLRAAVAAAERAADAQRDQYLAAGETDLRAGKVTGTGDDNAEAQFKAALKTDPGNARAQAGLGQVAEALIVQANAAIDAGHARDARNLLDHAATLAPHAADLAAARSRLTAAAQRHVATTAAAALSPADSAKMARLLARAQAAARKGDIMLPPGASAYDLYRAALALDGNDARAQAGLRALPQVTRNHFQQALRAGNLEQAHDMLDTLEQLDPGDAAAATMRHSLGSAWLDRADHYVGLGETAAARAALAEAQRLVPRDPRISEVDARIQHNN